ncbi:cell division protein ZapD [Pseudoduganella sp. SL102]|uniref:Cell division protein ZapD n=1 Tax=Pseudoduganella albidiflava TaxID=321983 RepID=A0A411X3H1_9BURK|nr:MULTISPECIES: cell division protein ZapD [Pseudoduganella]QBI03474.1 cell division protein ZapD [Pseudoduganella albidiflava]WBS04010.1 cell division protein ZapD [Pseudoduganella sp. SL102]GGY50289.1 cell division protein ZapD [Pseudoduganella albidiflava]
MIVYEYPFNERIRTLLRLEDLYEKFKFFLNQEHPLQHHVALSTIFDMLEVAGRADLKSDLLQEIERQKQTLMGYRSNPAVQAEMLDAILEELDSVSTALVASQGKTGQNVRDNEWLMSIRGRTIIPGGACEFDLPSYYAWQQHPFEQRYHDIATWFAPLAPLCDALALVLRLLRNSGAPKKMIANAGSYQQMLQGKVYQMLRLTLDESLGAIPEISANKYMLWVRFTSQGGDCKPKPLEDDVPFELTLCNF